MTTSDLLNRFVGLKPVPSDWSEVTTDITALSVDEQEWDDGSHSPPPSTPTVTLAVGFLNSLKEAGFPPPDNLWAWEDSIHLTWTFNYRTGCTDYIKLWVDVTDRFGVSIMISDGNPVFFKWEGH